DSSVTVEDVTHVRIPRSRRLMPVVRENRVVLRNPRTPDPLLSIDYGPLTVDRKGKGKER
ncbi:hypothetical protein HK104_001927, partial [Borealophlyctis nickersoniae]